MFMDTFDVLGSGGQNGFYLVGISMEQGRCPQHTRPLPLSSKTFNLPS